MKLQIDTFVYLPISENRSVKQQYMCIEAQVADKETTKAYTVVCHKTLWLTMLANWNYKKY